MAQANGPTNNQQQACEITIQGLWAQTGKYLDFILVSKTISALSQSYLS